MAVVTQHGVQGDTVTVSIGGRESRYTAETPPRTNAALAWNDAGLETLLRWLPHDVAHAGALLEPLVGASETTALLPGHS